MTIHVYSKPGCGKCESAKKKLQLMGLNYTEHTLEHYVKPHDGWREDGSVEVMAAHTMLDTMPIFRLNDEFHDYPTAMRKLKDSAPAAAMA